MTAAAGLARRGARAARRARARPDVPVAGADRPVVVLALAGVEALGYRPARTALLGVPLAEALDPFRTVLTVIDPGRSAARRGSRPSLVFIAGQLGRLVRDPGRFGMVMLRVWNPGRNEPASSARGKRRRSRSSRRSSRSRRSPEPALAVGRLVLVAARSGGPRPSRRSPPASATVAGDEAGATTGLHVPRRTHRRITRGPGRIAGPGPIRSSGAS